MKKTLLNSALGNMTGALAMTIMLGAGAAAADENNATAGDDQIAVQESVNDNLSNNQVDSHNDNDGTDADISNVANGSLNGNLSGNTVHSGNDNDQIDADVALSDVANDKSADDNDGLDLDLAASDVGNDKSQNSLTWSSSHQEDNSVAIGDVAYLASHQQLVGVAALVNMSTQSGDITTGSVMYGAEANKMSAGNRTSSINTGAGSVALSTSTIQAVGDFTIGSN